MDQSPSRISARTGVRRLGDRSGAVAEPADKNPMQLSDPAPSVYSGRLTRPRDGRRKDGANVSAVVIPLLVRDLTGEDLPSCAWSGSALHLVSVARELERARRGEVDYLAACPPVAVGGIDYAENPGAGRLYQLSVHPTLQSCGIGTIFIQAAEQRILARGLRRAELGVEEINRGPVRCMTGSATSLTAAHPTPGTNRPPTEPSAATRPCAR